MPMQLRVTMRDFCEWLSPTIAASKRPLWYGSVFASNNDGVQHTDNH